MNNHLNYAIAILFLGLATIINSIAIAILALNAT